MIDYFVDRTWMYHLRREMRGSIRKHFYNGVNVFIEFALSNNGNDREIRCPCSRCKLLKHLIPDMVKIHLRDYGFVPNYLLWDRHGELVASNPVHSEEEVGNEIVTTNPIEDMVEDAAESERNSANRNKNPVIHRGGFKSFQHHREDLERERGGPVSYMDVFAHTHSTKQTNEDGSTLYTWSDDKTSESYGKFAEARAQMLESSGRDLLTTDEENANFESIMKSTSRNKRYGFGNQAARPSQKAYQKAQDKEEIKELRAMIAELQEQDRRRAAEMALLNQRVAEYVQQHAVLPSSGGSGADDES